MVHKQIQQGCFPVFWEHDPYPTNLEFQRLKNGEKIQG